MDSNNKEIFLIRIPGPMDRKKLNGTVIDLNQSFGPIHGLKTEDPNPQLTYLYECHRNECQQNLVKLKNTSESVAKVDLSTKLCGYIGFRAKRNICPESENFEPLAKRHVVEPIENFIKCETNERLKQSSSSSKKKKRRHQ